jgi:hypothetical protein
MRQKGVVISVETSNKISQMICKFWRAYPSAKSDVWSCLNNCHILGKLLHELNSKIVGLLNVEFQHRLLVHLEALNMIFPPTSSNSNGICVFYIVLNRDPNSREILLHPKTG